MYSLIRANIIVAIRDKLFLGLILLSIASIMLSLFLGSTALVEHVQTSMVYSFSAIRAVIIIGISLFVCFHIRRLFDTKEMELLLSRPISRTKLIFVHWLSFVIVALIIMLLILSFMIPMNYFLLGVLNLYTTLYWSASLIAETIIVISYSMVISLILKSTVSSVLSCFAFYLASRMAGVFVAFLQSNPNKDIFEHIINIISIILPRLDIFSQTQWLVYSLPEYSTWLVQTIIYVPILLVVCVIDFNKKQV